MKATCSTVNIPSPRVRWTDCGTSTQLFKNEVCSWVLLNKILTLSLPFYNLIQSVSSFSLYSCVKFVENWKTVSGVLCDRQMNGTIKGKVYNYDCGTTDTDVGDLRGRDMGIEERTGKEI